jgi:NCS1 family nucleobase:cation symporter-1
MTTPRQDQKLEQLEELGLSVERHSIDHIPPSERHGKVHSLFAVWFGSNMQITTIVTGALGVIVGLSLPWAILALLLGNLFGTVFMALHSAQGPKLGIPQMIQSRAQFGFHGAILPIFLVVLMYIGFYASGVVLGGETLAAWWGIGFVPAAIILSLVSMLFTIYGYWAIHRLERFVSVVTAVAFIYLTYKLTALPGIGAAWHVGSLSFGPFLLVISIGATWQITYAPYVADYSRYLPEDTSIKAAFWWTYAGSAIASAWMMAIGATAAALARGTFDQGSSDFIVNLAPHQLHWAVSIVIILGIMATDVLNLYGMFMSSTTIITAVHPLRVGRRARTILVTVAAAIGTAVGIVGQGNFMTNLEDFILFLAYFLIPWTAINLADFYLVRKERYDLASIFSADGIYGRINWRTMIAYIVSVLAEIPFMSTTFYTGSAVSLLGGADIAWIVGLVLAAGLYVVLMRPVMGAMNPVAIEEGGVL